ncbi:MAG TPA: 3-hydroxyacyl-CoA dehydrogenase NAD-binding domain-containing protein, partial [Mycobacterium sp.]|nr:3-hydroxyacyl-CoA dehydrogenase NAD-binding domain-containing protein [Mycobacterium sp.]
LLPNLVGIETALRVIVGDALRNRTLQGPEALRLGIADAGFGAARFLEESIAWAGRVTAGTLRVRRPHRPGRLGRAVTWDAAVGVARRELTRSIGPVPKAPYEALELVKAAKSGSREAGFAREDAVLARLIRSEQFRASRYAFSLLHGRARRPAGVADPAAARPITKLGIVGAGLMASQIAALALYRLQVPVVVSDVDEEHVAAGLARIRATLAGLRERGRLDDDRLQRLVQAVTGTVDPAGFVGCDWVTEAVFEDLEAKRTALSRVEAYLDDEAILATNTSSLSVTQIAAGLARPERLVGFHFFNPVSRMPLVEVVPGAATSQAAVATAAALAGALRKTVIVTRDTTGFVVNRVLARFLSEVLGAVGSGTPLERVDRALQPIGLPMAPSMLLELVGLPVAAHVLAVHHEAFPARYQASERLARLAEHGRLYGRDDKGRPTTLDAKAAASLQGRGRARRPERILGDVQLALADEIHRMLEDRVVDAVEDIDLGLLLGAGWPMHTGGVTPYLDRVGASRRAFGGLFHDVGPGLPV